MKTLNRTTISAAIVLSVVIIFGVGISFLVRERRASETAVRETFRTAATELADNLALHVKIEDTASINRALANSYVAKAASFINVSANDGRTLFYLPEGSHPQPVASCRAELGHAVINYNGAAIGQIDFCYRLPAAVSSAGIAVILGTYVVSSILLALLLLGLVRFNNLQIADFLDWLNAIELSNPRCPRVPPSSIKDENMKSLCSKVSNILEQLGRLTTIELESQRARMLSDLSAQVAHDIRSPLAVLEAASAEMSGIPEDQRIMIRRAASHMRDIANSLLSRYVVATAGVAGGEGPLDSAANHLRGPALLSGLVEMLVSEKRLQFRGRSHLTIETSLDEHSYGLFALVEPTEFKRLLSNLINNAVEALPASGGRVDLDLATRDGHALISVRDNGKGIAPDVLAKLGARGQSHGKPGGSGLGLAHAREYAEQWGGRLDIESAAGQGTRVTVALPLAAPPAWFVPELEFAPGRVVVILDDDTSIHQVWNSRVDSLCPGERSIELVHVFNPDDLRLWIAGNESAAAGALYLLDYQLLGYDETGLDLAESLRLGEKAILVTNAHDEPGVAERCEELGMGLIPKNIAPFVSMRVSKAAGLDPELFDAVLIDDDELVHKLWQGAAQSNEKKLRVFAQTADFLTVIDSIDRRSPIYLDSRIGESVRGEVFARDLHARGFVSLFLATGQSPRAFGKMPWITKIVGKTAPWSVS